MTLRNTPISGGFITTKHALNVPIKEAGPFQDKKLQKELQKLKRAADRQKPIKALQKQLQQVEKQIRTLIKEDDILHHLFELVTSVSGVGEVIFWEVIITTNERLPLRFKLFSCPRKFACYAGFTPFGHSSGTSIRGKTRISHLANKKLKQLFHMAAMSVTMRENELADYYHRKVKEGKSKMSVLNAAAGARFGTRLFIGFLLVFATIENMKKTIRLRLHSP